MEKVFSLKRTALLAAVCMLLCSGLFVLPAHAQVFNTEVRIILASNSDQGFDPRLLDLKKDLLALNYMSFQLLDQSGLSLQKGKAGKIDIPGKRILKLTPTDFSQGKIEMEVLIQEGKSNLLKTRIRIENHGTVMIGGPPYETGFLVLAVTVHF
jgi:hypothetical protein